MVKVENLLDNATDLKRLAKKLRKCYRLFPRIKPKLEYINSLMLQATDTHRSAMDPGILDRAEKRFIALSERYCKELKELIKDFHSIVRMNEIDIHDMVFKFTL
jgi:hypothetical protein